jgi:CBS domain-containing protein
MTTVHEILRGKGGDVITIEPGATLHEAMQVLVQHNIGSLVVFDGEIRGILTERDLLRAGAEDPQQLVRARVEDRMTRTVITAPESVQLREVMDTMTERHIRHLPIVGDGELRGMISIGDVVNALRETTEDENRHLHSYIAGTPM